MLSAAIPVGTIPQPRRTPSSSSPPSSPSLSPTVLSTPPSYASRSSVPFQTSRPSSSSASSLHHQQLLRSSSASSLLSISISPSGVVSTTYTLPSPPVHHTGVPGSSTSTSSSPPFASSSPPPPPSSSPSHLRLPFQSQHLSAHGSSAGGGNGDSEGGSGEGSTASPLQPFPPRRHSSSSLFNFGSDPKPHSPHINLHFPKMNKNYFFNYHYHHHHHNHHHHLGKGTYKNRHRGKLGAGAWRHLMELLERPREITSKHGVYLTHLDQQSRRRPPFPRLRDGEEASERRHAGMGAEDACGNARVEQIKITCSIKTLLSRLADKFTEFQLFVRPDGIRLTGGGASCVLAQGSEAQLNDLDFTLYLDDDRRGSHNFADILLCEEEVLSDLVEEQTGMRLSLYEIYQLFFRESFRIDEKHEAWSLFRCGSDAFGIDIRVVERNRRNFVFSIDSFEIIVDPLLRRSPLTSASSTPSSSTGTTPTPSPRDSGGQLPKPFNTQPVPFRMNGARSLSLGDNLQSSSDNRETMVAEAFAAFVSASDSALPIGRSHSPTSKTYAVADGESPDKYDKAGTTESMIAKASANMLSVGGTRGSKTEVEVECSYGDFKEACIHLHTKQLRTWDPGSVRRGLFRYCLELAKGNRPSAEDKPRLEAIFVEELYHEFAAGASWGPDEVDALQRTIHKFMRTHKRYAFHALTFLHTTLSNVEPPPTVSAANQQKLLAVLEETITIYFM